MSLATALKGAVADARALQNPDFRRLWATQLAGRFEALTRTSAARAVVAVNGVLHEVI